MKTKQLLFASTLMGLSFAALAQNNGTTNVIVNDSQYLNSDPININGYVKPEIEATDQELETIRGDVQKAKSLNYINKKKTKGYRDLVNETEKLSETSEEMIEERLEAQEEMKEYNKKIDCMMGRASGPECDKYVKNKRRNDVRDQVQVGQAAPVVTKDIQRPANYGDNFGEMIKVIPYAGVTTFSSENENLEAEYAFGIKTESNVNNRFSVGIGFAYTQMKTQDFGSNSNYFGYGSGYGGYNTAYNNYYGSREIEYKNMNFNLYSKFFIVKNKRFRPYIGGGLGYNRTTMAYTDNRSNPYSSSYGYNYQFGDEEVTTSTFNAEMMLGSEIIFTETVGAVFEFNYQRGMGGNITSDNGVNPYNAPDQQRLEDLSEELSEANILSLYAGLLVQF